MKLQLRWSPFARDLGYVEGETIILDFRLSNGNFDALPELALQLVQLQVDVIATDSIGATRAAANATRSIPTGAAAGDPVALGFAASLNKPGGNVTGSLFLSFHLNAKRLQLLKYAFPAITRVTVLLNPRNPGGMVLLNSTSIEQAAKLLGIAINPIAANSEELRALARQLSWRDLRVLSLHPTRCFGTIGQS